LLLNLFICSEHSMCRNRFYTFRNLRGDREGTPPPWRRERSELERDAGEAAFPYEQPSGLRISERSDICIFVNLLSMGYLPPTKGGYLPSTLGGYLPSTLGGYLPSTLGGNLPPTK
jgi:hypothetical protein